MIVEFFVEGDPRPQGSKSGRVVWSKKKQRDVALLTDGFGEGTRKLKAWRKRVHDAASAWRLDNTQSKATIFGKETPVSVSLFFYIEKPKSVKRDIPTVKPDLDKLTRAVLDGLTGELFADDSQVVDLVLAKRYGRPGVKVWACEDRKGGVL